MALNFIDRYQTTLASAYTAGGTTLSVSSASGLPSGACNFYLIVISEAGHSEEVFQVTSVSGTTLTVTGGQAGTSNVNHSAGATVIGSIMTASAYALLADTSQSYANPAWISSLAWSKITGTPTPYTYQTPWGGDVDAANHNLIHLNSINTSGAFLGIGTTTPQQALDVGTGSVSAANYTIAGGATGAGTLGYYTGGSGIICSGNSNATYSGALYIVTNAANTRMVVTAAGNVGIANTAPLNLLEIGDAAFATALAGKHLTVTSTSSNSGINVGQSSSNRGRMMWVYNATPASAYMTLETVGGNPIVMQPTSGNVGIGTTAPNYPLSLGSGLGDKLAVWDGGSSSMFGFGIASGQMYIKATTATQVMTFLSTGQICIGTATAQGSNQLTLSQDGAYKTTTTTWTNTSDARVKRNIRTLEGGLSIVNKIRPIEAEYNGAAGLPEGQRVVSVLAQEIQPVLPGTISAHRAKLREEDQEETVLLGFNPHEMLFHMLLAIQQLSRKVEELELKISKK